mmetsp:Transcript_15040/g.45440  ORF Transcript_15040/g.45440 Transcript_15040/m.45440 type:complete len:200 (+) Transcript_15040:242-841(+)
MHWQVCLRNSDTGPLPRDKQNKRLTMVEWTKRCCVCVSMCSADEGPSRRVELGGIVESIDAGWVAQVVIQILQWALAGDDGLYKKAKHGEHGKAPILDLLHLELSEGVGVIGKAQGVERSTGVCLLLWSLPKWSTILTERLGPTHEDDLAGEGGNDGLGMHQGRVAQVVKPALVEDLGACLEPRGLLELHPVSLQQLGC